MNNTEYEIVARTFREESGLILAALINTVRDFEVAEDALQGTRLSTACAAPRHWRANKSFSRNWLSRKRREEKRRWMTFLFPTNGSS